MENFVIKLVDNKQTEIYCAGKKVCTLVEYSHGVTLYPVNVLFCPQFNSFYEAIKFIMNNAVLAHGGQENVTFTIE